MMLKAHQSLSNKELSLRNKTMVDFYIGVIKRYRKELLKLSTLIVADAYFSTSTFVNGIKKEGFSLISRFVTMLVSFMSMLVHVLEKCLVQSENRRRQR